jgi:C4-dicarboxylate-specific signal transduction histidine kinase
LPRKKQKEKQRSLKLGLALSEAIIIDAWRRDLRAREGLGKGMAFMIELPTGISVPK